MMTRFIVAACFLFGSFSAVAVEDMTREEALVRNAYAKLSYAVDINTVYRAVQANPNLSPADLAKQVDLHGLRFKLTDFNVGNLADISETKFTDAFPQYDDDVHDVIHTSIETENYSEVGGETASMHTATATWGPPPSGRTPSYTVRQMIPILQNETGVSPLLRYCSFMVTATLAGRSRTYEASFLFGENGQAAPLDVIADVGGGALGHMLLHPIYPDVLLRTKIGKVPVVRNFLEANQRSEASCKSGDACCNAETLQCGVYNADLSGRRP